MKKLVGLFLALMMGISLFAACSSTSSSASSSSEAASSASSASSSTASESKSKEQEEVAEKEVLKSTAEIDALLAKLTKNEYPELSIAAEITEKSAILPGSAVKVTITLKNNGDKTIVYEHGSGTFETPQALFMRTSDLQPVIPKDHLGVATMDFQNKELKPGEEKTFDLHLIVIKPNDEFATMTHTVFDSENKYIVDLEWDVLHDKYPSLEKAAVGDYTGEVYFTYYVMEEGATMSATAEPTGYAEASFSLTVTE